MQDVLELHYDMLFTYAHFPASQQRVLAYTTQGRPPLRPAPVREPRLDVHFVLGGLLLVLCAQ